MNNPINMTPVEWFSEQAYKLFERLESGEIDNEEFCKLMVDVHKEAIYFEMDYIGKLRMA